MCAIIAYYVPPEVLTLGYLIRAIIPLTFFRGSGSWRGRNGDQLLLAALEDQLRILLAGEVSGHFAKGDRFDSRECHFDSIPER